MSRKLLINCICRHFSRSTVWKNLEKAKPTELQPAASEMKSMDDLNDVVAQDWEKRLMVWTGRFKRIEDVPPRISINTISKEKTRARIFGSTILMILTAIACVAVSYAGKKRAAEGDTTLKQYEERKKKLLAEALKQKNQNT